MGKKREVPELKMELIKLPLSSLIPYEKNNKQHWNSDTQELAKLIKKNWYIDPIQVDQDNIILAGHGRKMALTEMGWDDGREIQVFRVTGFKTEEQKRHYRISHNTSNWLAKFDIENITIEINEIWDYWLDIVDHLRNQGYEIKIDLWEFTSADELNVAGQDEVPPLPEKVYVQEGDIFQLWEHRLMFWDSTKKENLAKLMGKDKAHMVFTDPPYNVNYKGRGEKTGTDIGIKNDNMDTSNFTIFLNEIFARYKENIIPESALYVFHASSTQREFENALEHNGFRVKTQLIWNKPTLVLGRGGLSLEAWTFLLLLTKRRKNKFLLK